jgi:amino acid adenylation domain-containing protein
VVNETVQGFPLSVQQKHLWALEQDARGCPYRVQAAVRIDGELDRERLRTALEGIVRAHEILRTSFRRLPGMAVPLQVIGDGRPPEVEEMPADDPGPDRIDELLRRARQAPLPAGDPLGSVSLVAAAPDRHWLLVQLPALCGDAASLQVLVRELARRYGAGGEAEELAEEVLQYADFAAYQEELLASERAREVTPQGQNLTRVEAALNLPFEKLGDAPPFRPETVPVSFKPDFTGCLDEIAYCNGVEVFDVLLACWQLLLGRLTGKSDLVVSVRFDGRDQPELRGAIGPFASYLPLGCHINEASAWEDVVRQARRAREEAARHQGNINPQQPRSAADEPVCSAAFEADEFVTEAGAGGVTFSVAAAYACTEPFKVKLACARGQGGLGAELHYDVSRITAEDARLLAERYETLLASALDSPGVPAGRLDVLGAAERRKLLVEFNDTEMALPVDRCVHELFEESAGRAPGNAALVVGDRRLSYEELNARANQLARHLIELGVGPEVLVGVFADRSVEAVVGILGVLKAGGAYVPLDPTYPRERNAFVLQDARPAVVLTQARLRAGVTGAGVRVVYLDEDWAAVARHHAGPLPTRAGAENLAYVIYTSGTTGGPKGVQVTHGSLGHYAQAIRQPLELTATDVFLHTASLAFSSSVRQLLVPLAHGATVVMASSDERRSPLTLFELVKRHGVTVVDLVPSHWQSCLQALAALEQTARRALLDNRLRLCLSASEALWSDVPKTWLGEFAQPARFLNMFGHTETTGIVATFPVPAAGDGPRKVVPLGRPIPNTRIYLLDEHRRPVPLGTAGEVFVGGAGLARGYLNRPELTAEKFVPDPYTGEPGARLYRTGDLGRFTPAGDLEYLGRIDHQVKIRGHRVELGEIEARLLEHPAVRAAVAVARGDDSDKRLVAYVVPKAGPVPTPTVLREFLKERLPEYMVPATVVPLDALPLTPNGKVNRQALPEPDHGASEESFVAPQSPVEVVLAKVWGEVLGLKRVGVEDSFFDLGGHSLLATRLMSRVRETFRTELPLRSLFEAPTVAGLARLLVAREAKPGLTEKIARVVQRLEGLSEADARAAVEGKRKERGPS